MARKSLQTAGVRETNRTEHVAHTGPDNREVVSVCQASRIGTDDHHRLGKGGFISKRHGEMRGCALGGQSVQLPLRRPGECQGRLAPGGVDHADMAPKYAVPDSGTQGLDAGFLGGKPPGIDRGAVDMGLGIGPFFIGEHTVGKTRPVAGQHPAQCGPYRPGRCPDPKSWPGRCQNGDHAPHRRLQTKKKPLHSPKMTDIEFTHRGHPRHRGDIIISETVSGMAFKTTPWQPGRRPEPGV